MRTEKIETEHHRRVYAAERISAELAGNARNRFQRPLATMPAAGREREEWVDRWLDRHPEVVVGAVVPR